MNHSKNSIKTIEKDSICFNTVTKSLFAFSNSPNSKYKTPRSLNSRGSDESIKMHRFNSYFSLVFAIQTRNASLNLPIFLYSTTK